jgi:FAD/FMN-containing dehydrogenase
MASEEKIQTFLDDLSNRVSGDLRSDDYSRILYSTDASIYQVLPYGILLPDRIEDVQATVELAAKYQVPILPRTAGSSLVGQAVNEALVIDFTRHLNQIIELNEEEHWVRVQPGIVLDELNAYLRPKGLQFGPDPASSNRAAMGGITSNNSTGAHSILYGMTADHLLETEVILSDGSTTLFGPLEEKELQQRMQLSGLEGDIYRAMTGLVRNPKNQEFANRRRATGDALVDTILTDSFPRKVYFIAYPEMIALIWPRSFAAQKEPWRLFLKSS